MIAAVNAAATVLGWLTSRALPNMQDGENGYEQERMVKPSPPLTRDVPPSTSGRLRAVPRSLNDAMSHRATHRAPHALEDDAADDAPCQGDQKAEGTTDMRVD
ncbi:hypothetical protein ACVIHH_003052 [Bradyrhizobium sp. USDA 4518]